MAYLLEPLIAPRRVGEFSLVARLGEGGMAAVYLAAVGRGAFLRPAAVKLLRPDLPDDEYRLRFLDEARVVVRLHHNNLVDVRAAGEADGQLYIAMELVDGRDLSDIWDRCAEVRRSVPIALSVHMVAEVLRGLHYAHRAEGLALVHRDVSPSNILVDWHGAVRLSDFGLATSALRTSVTLPGVVFGKVGYMSPEQARREPLDPRTDVFSCGVVLWELVTGRPLRRPGTDTNTVAQGRVPPIAEVIPGVDAELSRIVAKATCGRREDRYPSAGAFAGALRRWLVAHAPGTGQEALAAFLHGLFGEERHAQRRKIRECLAGVAGSDRTLVFPRSGPSRRRTSSRSSQDMSASAPHLAAGEFLAPGTVVGDRYRIVERLGTGGMGAVYLAEHLTVGRSVAVKVLSFAWCHDPTVVERFREEARTASSIGHPNIVEVFDAGTLPDGRLYIAMELLSGQSLYDAIAESGPMELPRALRYLREVARALRAAHRVGVVHRDLKPENVMLARIGEEERIKVLDFGISSRPDRAGDGERLTRAGQAIGTPEYMSPEQARGAPPAPAQDIYAFGVLAYEMLCGVPPIVGASPADTMARKLTEPAPALREKRPDVPEGLSALVDRCLSQDPAARPPSMDAVLADLELALRGLARGGDGSGAVVRREGTGVPPPPERTAEAAQEGTSGPRWSKRWLVAASVVAVLSMAAGMAVMLAGTGDAGSDGRGQGGTPTPGPAAARGDGSLPAAVGGAAPVPGPLTPSGDVAPGEPSGSAAGDRGRGDAPAVGPGGAASAAGAGKPSGPPDQAAAPVPAVGRKEAARRGKQAERRASSREKANPDARAAVASTACVRARREAESAYEQRRWQALLRATRRAACFPDRARRRVLRMRAHLELGDFDACLRERGGGSPEARRLAAFCRKRLEGG